MKARAEQAAKRAAERAEEAQRAYQTLEKLKDPDFDPLQVEDYDDTTSDSTELKSAAKEKTPSVKDKLKMFEAMESAAHRGVVQEEWGDVPPPPRRLMLPAAFAALEQAKPRMIERRPPPGHIIFPDDPRVYQAKPLSPVTPPPPTTKGRDVASGDQNIPARRYKCDTAPSYHTAHHAHATTLLLRPPPLSDLAHEHRAHGNEMTTTPAPSMPPTVRVLRSPVLSEKPTPPPVREQKPASATLVTQARSVDAKLAAYEKHDAAARASPDVGALQVEPGKRVSGHLSKFESLDAAARATPTTENVTPSPGKRVSGHLSKYESLDAAARAPLPPPIDLNDHDDDDDDDDGGGEYHSLRSIERRQQAIFQKAGIAPTREIKSEPARKAGGAKLSGMLAMYEAKDEAARAEKEIESVERRSVVAAMTRQRLVD